VPARVHRISAFHLSHTAVGGMKLLLSGKLETVLSTMFYKMAESELAGKMMRRFTIASEDFLQYLEAWVHGGPEPARAGPKDRLPHSEYSYMFSERAQKVHKRYVIYSRSYSQSV
jgi:hypothetical protein